MPDSGVKIAVIVVIVVMGAERFAIAVIAVIAVIRVIAVTPGRGVAGGWGWARRRLVWAY